MKVKKGLSAKLVIVWGIVLAIIAGLLVSVEQSPAITEHSFPFSITYEFDGEVITIEDEYICTFGGVGFAGSPIDRDYDGYFANADQDLECGDYLIKDYGDKALIIITNLFGGYMMGDPQDKNYYNEYLLYEPYIAVYDYDEYTEASEPEALAPYNVKIVDWEYPEPIENKFVISGLCRLSARTVVATTPVSLLTLLVCIFFVKKGQDVTYNALDKISVFLNFVSAFVVLPFLFIVCSLFEIVSVGGFEQTAFCIPAAAGFGIAASVCLRRKGYRVSGFFIQFIGVLLLMVFYFLDIL